MIEPDDIALKILNALAGNPDRLGRFIDLTGLQLSSLREAIGKEEFWVALYDYVASDEPLLLEIASEIGETPEAVMLARRRLAPPETFD